MSRAPEILERVMRLMNWDLDQAMMWYYTRNPMLGGATPKQLVLRRRGLKLLQMIQAAENEYGHKFNDSLARDLPRR